MGTPSLQCLDFETKALAEGGCGNEALFFRVRRFVGPIFDALSELLQIFAKAGPSVTGGNCEWEGEKSSESEGGSAHVWQP